MTLSLEVKEVNEQAAHGGSFLGLRSSGWWWVGQWDSTNPRGGTSGRGTPQAEYNFEAQARGAIQIWDQTWNFEV